MTFPNPSSVLVPGTLLGGKYRVDAPIAEGGMSLVVLARDIAIDERVAIKLLKPEQRLMKDVLARFVREAKTIRRVQSDRCVKVHDVGMDPVHGPFMVMEFLDGRSLRNILDGGGRFVPKRAVELALQICEALAAAHTVGCIHRDVKPDNVVVLQRGEIEDVRVLDFGISKHALTGSVLNQDISLINTISLMGSPTYMSPEQMRSTANADARSDIWSLGAVLFEMLTGRPPFVSESITELCSMVISDAPPLASTVEAAVPVALAQIVSRCLQKNPADRYRNVGELAQALIEFAPRRARMSLDRTLAVLGSAGASFDDDDGYRESTLIMAGARTPSSVAVTPPPAGGSYPPPFTSNAPPWQAAISSSSIAFVAPTTDRRLAAMPTVVSQAKVEQQRRRSTRWAVAVGVLAIPAFLMLLAGIDARSRRRAVTTTAVARPNVEMPLPPPAVEAPVVTPVAPIETAAPVVSAAVSAAPVAPASSTAPKKPRSRPRVVDDDDKPVRPRVVN